MAKRPTIGENPLDAVMAETPLDTVLPVGGPQAGRPPEEPSMEVKKRLAALEAEVKVLKGEISLLKGKLLEVQVRMPPPEPRWVTRLREKLAGK